MSTEYSFESCRAAKEKERFLSTGCKKLDESLKGGIPCQGVTQIYGAASTGKTQLGLQLCMTVQLPLDRGGLDGGAIYICTQSPFPSRRLQQLLAGSPLVQEHKISGDPIYVEHTATVEELETCLLRRIPILMSARKINLIVVDSIAAPYRTEDWNDTTNTRGKSLRAVGKQLHKLCKNNDVCVVCINQVSAVISRTMLRDNPDEAPTLGTSWTSMVTTSLRFYRNGDLRYIEVKSSSRLQNVTIPFEVCESGVRAID